MELGIIGTSVWQQNLPLIEKLTIDRETRAGELKQLKSLLGLSELLYVATCNRVEFIYVAPEPDTNGSLLHRLLDFFFSGGRDISFFPNDFYCYRGKEAVNHLFRTTASLESLVIGETQITGQLSDARAWSVENGLCGSVLDTLAKESMGVAKRVRRETEIGRGAVSMASLAVTTLRSELSDRKNPRIALVGSGTMTVKCASHLKRGNECELIFVSRTKANAEELVAKHGGEARCLDEFQKNPGQIDAIVSATAAKGVVFDADFLAKCDGLEEPVVCVDLAIPRDFSEAFDDSPQAVLVDIAELRVREQRNMRKRFTEVGRAGEIIEEEVERYFAERIEISLKPIFHRSYQESVAMAEQAFADLFNNRLTVLSEEERQAVLRLVNRVIGHTCFQPAKALSDQLADGGDRLLSQDVFVSARESA